MIVRWSLIGRIGVAALMLAAMSDPDLPIGTEPAERAGNAPSPVAAPRIAALHAPVRALPGEALPVTVEVADASRPVEVTLSLDGKPTATVRTADAGRADIVPGPPGVHEIAAVIAGADSPSVRRRLIEVAAGPEILVIAREGYVPAIAAALAGAGLAVRTLPPSSFDGRASFDVAVLDDIAIGDLDEAAWRGLHDAVSARGSGLLVLGGPRSFAAGRYRASLLESVLPVTVEAPRPAQETAILFLVDKSGSMNEPRAGAVPFAFARRAVAESAATLADGDALGLLWFDREPVAGLALARRADPARAIDDAWTVTPGGGTAVAPALRRGVGELARWPAARRVLAIVTDGAIDTGEPVAELAEAVREARIDVVVVLVGEGADAGPLAALAAVNDGLVLKAAEIPTLPERLVAELEERRSPVAAQPVLPVERRAVPYLAGTPAWPRVEAHWVTRPRTDATVQLTAPDGAPLLAVQRAGAGMVAVLPAGVGPWAPAWRTWPELPAVAAALVRWLAPANEEIVPEIRTIASGLEVVADWMEAGAWGRPIDGEATARDPNGRTIRAALVPVAPGRHRAAIPAAAPGRYDIALRLGDRGARAATIHDPPAAERHARSSPPQPADRTVALAAPLLAAALALYLVVVATERRRWLR